MTQAHPVLAGRRVRIRSGRPGDAERLRAILAEPSVSQWWGEPDPLSVIEDELAGDDTGMLLVMEIGGQVAGGIQYSEENDPMYKHAGIDIYLATRFQGQGAGTEAVALLARYLFSERGHHRITIDPAAHNDRAIRSYAKVGFRPVGVMRQYERGPGGRFHDGLLMDLLRGELAAEIVSGRQYAAAMANFAVRLVHGPGWDASRPIRSQDGWDEHAAFMDGLVDDGFLILGGPVGDGEPPEQTLHAVEAADEDEVRARLAQDPWARAGLLRIGTIEPWALWLDGRRGQPAP